MPLATSPSSERLPSRPSKRVTAPRPHRETVSRVRVAMVSEKDEPAGRSRPAPNRSDGPAASPRTPIFPGLRAGNRTPIADPLAGERQLDVGPARRPLPVGQVLHRALRPGLPFPVSGLPRTLHPRPTPLRTAARARSAARRGAPRRRAPASPAPGRPPHPIPARPPCARSARSTPSASCRCWRSYRSRSRPRGAPASDSGSTASGSESPESSSSSSSSTGTETVFSVCRGREGQPARGRPVVRPGRGRAVRGRVAAPSLSPKAPRLNLTVKSRDAPRGLRGPRIA